MGHSFSTMEAGTLPAAPDCGRMGTAGSLRARCHWRTDQVGMGWCGHWPGPGIPGQTLGLLGDTYYMQSRLKVPVRKYERASKDLM